MTSQNKAGISINAISIFILAQPLLKFLLLRLLNQQLLRAAVIAGQHQNENLGGITRSGGKVGCPPVECWWINPWIIQSAC